MIVVLGGGVTGLSAAWHFVRTNNNSKVKITLLEAAQRTGGWIKTRCPSLETRVLALAEAGPRTLRPVGIAGTATLEMASQPPASIVRLGITDQLVAVPKSSPAATNRFIQYKGKLDKMPTSLVEALFPPKNHVFRGVVRRGALEPFIPKSNSLDESIHDFVSRRFGNHVAENMISALVHGIFAGDSRILSVRSCFPSLWEAEQKYGSVVRSLIVSSLSKQAPESFSPDISVKEADFIKRIKSSSIYSFKNGLETLTNAIEADLKQNYPNVTILKNTEVTQINPPTSPNAPIVIETKNGEKFNATNVISSISSGALAPLLPENSPLGLLLAVNPAVNVVVVNLNFENPPNTSILPISGFGYLVPRTQPSPVIGVIFDSETIPEQSQGTPHITRLTCMMGGARFNEIFGSVDTFDKSACLETAVATVRKDLNITAPLLSSHVSLHKNCITQYTVGHAQRLQKIDAILRQEFDGRLAVAGSSYLGVGVNDCVLGARDIARRLQTSQSVTGLERAVS